MANGNGDVQVIQKKGNDITKKADEFNEHKPFEENIFGRDETKKPIEIEKTEEKIGKGSQKQIEEIVKYLSNIHTFNADETKVLEKFVKKCFSANRSDLIKEIDEKQFDKKVAYSLKNNKEIRTTSYPAYIKWILNDLIVEKENSPEIRNIFNAIDTYNRDLIFELNEYQSNILLRMYCETEEGRSFLISKASGNNEQAQKILNEYYLNFLEKNELKE